MKVEIIAEHKAEIFKAGFVAAGYTPVSDNKTPGADDVLVAWNRKPSNEGRIKYYENARAKVIIAENGYIGKDADGNKLLSLAHNYHLGAGRWYIGEEKRYLNQNFIIEPWRAPGEEIILLAQRGIGNAKRLEWYIALADKIRARTKRKVIVRPHPGKIHSPVTPALTTAHAVVTWSSAAAIHALAFGVPSFHLMPGWIGEPTSKFGIEDLENPARGDRDKMFHRISWAQWTAEEIRNGEAIKRVMSV